MKPFEQDLASGSFGRDVLRLQVLLEVLNYDDFIPTGYYGDKTKSAVAKFQIRNSIQPTFGNFGPKTRRVMNEIISSNRNLLYYTALGCLGIDASPNDVAPDEYGCAETVCDIIERAFPATLMFTVSTYSLYNELLTNKAFTRVDAPMEGDIVISPTGYGNGGLSNGHVGILGKNGMIMSNSSNTGQFTENYDIPKWKKRYCDIGGYPMIFFRKI